MIRFAAEIDSLVEEHYKLQKVIGKSCSMMLYCCVSIDFLCAGGYMLDLDKELGLGLYPTKHGLPDDEQKKANKRRKKAKAVQ